MGKTKELLEQMNEANQMVDDSYQYNEWLQSDEFVEYVNREIDKTRPQYSEQDIMDSIRYASTHITIDPSEVGKQVYDMLFSEKIEEYLSLYTIR
jgi:hypothetical protein